MPAVAGCIRCSFAIQTPCLPPGEHVRRLEELKTSTREFYVAQARRLELVAGMERRVDNERPSRFLFLRVKAREKRVEMASVRGDGGLVTSTPEILEAVGVWYDDLFSVRGEDQAAANSLLDGLTGALTEGGWVWTPWCFGSSGPGGPSSCAGE